MGWRTLSTSLTRWLIELSSLTSLWASMGDLQLGHSGLVLAWMEPVAIPEALVEALTAVEEAVD